MSVNESMENDKTLIQNDIILLETEDKEILEINSGDTLGRDGTGKNFMDGYKTISRKHAKIIYDSLFEYWYVLDLNSSNGTYLNGEKIESENLVRIKTGDEICLSTKFKLKCIIPNQ